ncbi:NAD(P)-dependent oxidoreductase [Levilactobacillus bambusae]|uniref:Phosphoglycerate dehydrogenase n=1 Tax=Levilactobacillus bambusae TaxID=2024736 RepID=A0A2V1MY42_9LACO|nr:NAD(P)-dependent oxidoreductase [Levilactobacillus bambusae]PWF99943.1 phosphoglycerate dehydrogenase [Levilactobacillus bambusae]
MSINLLNLAPGKLSATDLQAITNLGVTVLNPTGLTPAQFDSVDIVFGWNGDVIDQLLNSSQSNLKWIQLTSAGIDYLPLKRLAEHHIMVSNVSGAYSQPIAESVIAFILFYTRDLSALLTAKQNHSWLDKNELATHMSLLKQQKVVIFGTGSIAQHIAKLLNGFGNFPVGINHSGHPADGFSSTETLTNAADVVKTADIIINTLPLTAETTDYFNADFFDLIQDLNIFISVGRGKSLDQTALLSAMRTNRVHRAALDVFQQEPVPADSPLWDQPNLIVSPHATPGIDGTNPIIFDILEKNLRQFIVDGTLATNQVDLQRGY